ncbi:hypothetical protein [Tenacibaculum sp. 47A_GOM-205m]|uniref:hypothetical protein n=1 Tax=Tenacibaculum sp. 47A_GOM-205m TaxID=1380384 RepID=UPI00048ACF48|nr:hypothetical protein [Tenacibaculum sp. 47A_GOM-205m]
MKNLFKVVALVLVIGFASCTDENEVVPTEKEQQLHEQELFGINKGDVTNPGGGGAEDPEDTEN